MIVDADGVRRYFGKYRGKVASTMDEMGMGRIKVTVANILENETWAMPCVPYAASGVGFYVIPPEEADVWVEFEQGLRENPIWSGCFWGQMMSAPQSTPGMEATTRLFKTDQIELKLTETPAGGEVEITLTVPTGSISVKLGASGVTVDAGTGEVKIDGMKVAVNSGALEVV